MKNFGSILTADLMNSLKIESKKEEMKRKLAMENDEVE